MKSSSAPGGGEGGGAGRRSVELTADDLHWFNEGSHRRLYEKLGSHLLPEGGCRFTVWAPNARAVSVIGDFNGWDGGRDALSAVGSSGLWDGTVASAGPGSIYRYRILPSGGGPALEKADPLASHAETPPRTGSVVWDLDFHWNDDEWMDRRRERNGLQAPMSIYELHLGSWRRKQDGAYLSYRELTPRLVEHVRGLGFTHVELMPVMEHPFFGSWGYQCTGYFAPTSRYGTPQDLMYLIDTLHQADIGVILDWVPSHFPTDGHGLGLFDGTHLYEHADPRQGFHPDWTSWIFNYDRHEIVSFLISSAFLWLDRYHADGLRVDAVASMLYLDYSREEGEWIPNPHGGRENLGAIRFLRQMNDAVAEEHPGVQMIAEESTSFPGVTRPSYLGGLGFGLKWDMGWMHDTLIYLARDPVHRRYHHNDLTFRMIYAYSENFLLPLSHDEVVHGKGSLLGKMAGDEWQRFAHLRLLYGYMFSQPGKKLLFMGAEFGQLSEWQHDGQLDWGAADLPRAAGLSHWLGDLNRIYRSEAALHSLDCDPAGHEWIDPNDADHGVLTFLRRARDPANCVVVACNFTPLVRHGYVMGVPMEGIWREMLNSDAETYGGSGQGNLGQVRAEHRPANGREYSISVTLPALSVVFFRPEPLPGTA